jgi:hypothetical protein
LANGTPLLSCATGGRALNFARALFNRPADGTCTPGGSLHCVTNASVGDLPGQCSVVFRRIRDPIGSTPPRALSATPQDLVVSAVGAAPVDTSKLPGPAPIQVAQYSGAPHILAGWLDCTTTDPNVTARPALPISVNGATFSKNDFSISGTQGQLTCTPTVVDTNPSAATLCSNGIPPSCPGNPDQYDANAPIGTISFLLPSGQNITCTLNTLPLVLNITPPQPSNVTPYASACPPQTFTVDNSGGTTFDLVPAYTSPNPPEHAGTLVRTQLQFT